MIGHIRGGLLATGAGWAIIETGGIGWRVVVSAGSLDMYEQHAEVSLLVHTQVREDAITLYGFTDAQSMDAFHTLVAVQGMGPSLALSLLGCMSVPEIASAIVGGDVKTLCRAHGVGARIAGRLVSELARKKFFTDLANHVDEPKPAASVLDDIKASAVRALVRLDISKTAANAAVLDVMTANPKLDKVEELVRLALPVASRN